MALSDTSGARQSRTLQKKIIMIILTVALLAAAAYGVMILADGGFFTRVEEVKPGGFIFDPVVDYDYDIMTDDAYLRLLAADPFVSLYTEENGTTVSLDPEDYDKNGGAVKLLTDLLLAIQAGDADGYNACFSDAYHAVEGYEDGFTMQEIYAAVITVEKEITDEATGITTSYCRLKYKINRNNATLRADMGSGSYREQSMVLDNDTDDGCFRIRKVTTFSEYRTKTVVLAWRIVLISAAFLAVAGGAVACDVILFRKWGKEKTNEEASGS